MSLKTVREIGGSLEDFAQRARDAFRTAFVPLMADGTYPPGTPRMIDVFDDHVIAREREAYFQVAMTLADDETITFAPRAEWIAVKLAYVQEMAGQQIGSVVSEFKGGYPDVPTAAGVDVDALTAGDEDPFFVTLPVAELDVTSANKIYFDADLVKAIERQISEKRPVGLMGHIPADERATAFPIPVIHWVGAARQGKTVWGKGYIPPGEVREFVRRLKSTGAKIATSIYGIGDHTWDSARGAWSLSNFVLESIDLAPPERASVQTLAVVPKVTAEMARVRETPMEGTDMDRLEIIKALTAEDARLLPDAVRQAVLSADGAGGVVAEMRTALGLDDKGNVVDALKVLAAERDALRQEVVAGAIREAVAEVKVDSMRGIVSELIQARKPQSKDDVKRIAAEVLDSEAVKAQLQAAVVSEMGPKQTRPAQRNVEKNGEGWKQFVDIPASA